jgi:AP-1 complex subunit mu
MGFGPSGIYILDQKGKVIIHRAYRGDAPTSAVVSDKFIRQVLDQEDLTIRPVFTVAEIHYLWIKYSNIYLVATTKLNANAMMVFSFLYKLSEVFTEYFRELEEESIKDNFVVIYELLDEMIDNGYP